jgi:hypothetical protein
LIEKSFRRNNCATRDCRPQDIENMLMARAGGMQMQIEIARERFELLLRKRL